MVTIRNIRKCRILDKSLRNMIFFTITKAKPILWTPMLSYYPHSNLCNTGAVNIPFFFRGWCRARSKLWRSLKRLFFAGCCMAQQVVVLAVALLSANTKNKVAMSLSKLSYFVKQRQRKTNNQKKNTNLNAVSQRVQGGSDVACSSDG